MPAAFPTVAATTRSSWLPLALVVALWAALRAAFGAGLSASDPLEYVSIAQRIAEGRFELTTHHYATRFAVTGPLALLIRGFGVSEPVVIAWPLACSLGTLLLLFVIGRRHGGPAVGLIAAATWAVLPLDVIESTNVLPDPILAFFATLAIDSFERGLAAPDDRRARPWLLLAGLAIWAAYSAKIAGALLAPIFAIHAATVGLRGRRLAWVAVGTLSVLLPELAWYQVATGDALLPIHGVSAVHNHSVGVAAANDDLFDRLVMQHPRKVLLPNEHFGVLGPLLLLGVVFAWRERRRAGLLFLVAGGLFAYLGLGSSSFDRFVAIPANTRYLHPVAAPLVVLAALAARRAWEATNRLRRGRAVRAALATVALLLAASSVASSYVHGGRSFVHLTFREGMAAAASLRSAPPTSLRCDPRTAAVVRFAFASRPPFALLSLDEREGVNPFDGIEPGGALLLNWREIGKFGDDRALDHSLFEKWNGWLAGPLPESIERFCETPARPYFCLAKLPWIFPAVRRDDRSEFFVPKKRPTGVWRVDVPP